MLTRLSAPIRGITNFRLHPAERVDIVIDFADPPFQGVTQVFLENRMEQQHGRGPDGLGAGTPLLQFRLQDARPDDPSRVPDTLRRHDAMAQAELAGATRRTFEFERRNGAWAIHGQCVDLGAPLAQSPVNATERWRLVNKSGGWVHPVHIRTHDNQSLWFYDDLLRGKVVLINFLYVTCGDICPLMTANLVRVQAALGERLGREVFMYSMTLDPQTDTPEALKQYAEGYGVKPGWSLLIGQDEEI